MQKTNTNRLASSSHVNLEARKQVKRRTPAEIESQYCIHAGNAPCSFHGSRCPRQQRLLYRVFWRCMPPKFNALNHSKLQTIFESCADCSNRKEYKTAGMAAGHLKRCHLRLEEDGQGSKSMAKYVSLRPGENVAVAPSVRVLKELRYLKKFEVPNPDYKADTDEHDPSEPLQSSTSCASSKDSGICMSWDVIEPGPPVVRRRSMEHPGLAYPGDSSRQFNETFNKTNLPFDGFGEISYSLPTAQNGPNIIARSAVDSDVAGAVSCVDIQQMGHLAAERAESADFTLARTTVASRRPNLASSPHDNFQSLSTEPQCASKLDIYGKPIASSLVADSTVHTAQESDDWDLFDNYIDDIDPDYLRSSAQIIDNMFTLAYSADSGYSSNAVIDDLHRSPTIEKHGAPAHNDTSSPAIDSTFDCTPYIAPPYQNRPSATTTIESDRDVALGPLCAIDEQPHGANTPRLKSAGTNVLSTDNNAGVTDCQNPSESSSRPESSPRSSSETLGATPESASQLHVQRNPFARRLRNLVKQIALEEGSDCSSDYGSDTDSDNASVPSGRPCSGNGYQSCQDSPDSDIPGSSNSSGSGALRPAETNTRGSSSQASGSSRPSVDQIRGLGDGECVQTDIRQAQNEQGSGTVICCPIGSELECTGKDENMSSHLRELSNAAHNIFYCNVCKKLLSRIIHNNNASPEDVKQLRILRKKNKEQWQAHQKACHDGHCVMLACAPDPHGDLRHVRTPNCKTNREDEKQADAKYLFRTLGVAERDVEVGVRSDHKGKRKSSARKAVELAIDATQRNVEIDEELRDCRQEIERLKEVDRTGCLRVGELEKVNEELCSILRHALEDMERGRMIMTNALHDRIKRHAPSALETYSARREADTSPAPVVPSLPRTPASLSQESVSKTYRATDNVGTASINSPALLPQANAQTKTPTPLAPPAKRRRMDSSTPVDVPAWSSSIPHDSADGHSISTDNNINRRPTASQTDILGSMAGTSQDPSAPVFQETRPNQLPQNDTALWQQKLQQVADFTMHEGGGPFAIDWSLTATESPFIPSEHNTSSQEQFRSPMDFVQTQHDYHPNANAGDMGNFSWDN